MDAAGRRRVGLALITVTAFLALVLATLTQRDVAGRPARAERPPLPPVGACVSPGPPVTVLDCRDRHVAEVVATWPATVGPDTEHGYGTCLTAAAGYVGTGTDAVKAGWATPTFLQTVRIVTGPGARPLPGWSWTACLIIPVVPGGGGQGYSGTIANLTQVSTPVELRRCFVIIGGPVPDVDPGAAPVAASQFTTGVSCRADHRGEVLGVRRVRIPGPSGGPAAPSPGDSQQIDTDPGRAAECGQLARTVLGVADPSFDHRLVLRIRLEAVGVFTSVSPNSEIVTDVDYAASCTIEAPPGRVLFGSLAGIGNAPLPLR